jgi:hypothetical protein
MDDLSVEANQQRRLWHTVTTSMLHDCNKSCEGRIPEQCNKYFPKEFSAHTVLSGCPIFCSFFVIYCSKILAERYAQYVRLNPEGAEEAVQTEVGAQATNEQATANEQAIEDQELRNADANAKRNTTVGPSQDTDHREQVQYRRLKPPADDVIDWVLSRIDY